MMLIGLIVFLLTGTVHGIAALGRRGRKAERTVVVASALE
jgi:hypothetical protein